MKSSFEWFATDEAKEIFNEEGLEWSKEEFLNKVFKMKMKCLHQTKGDVLTITGSGYWARDNNNFIRIGDIFSGQKFDIDS